MTTNWKKLVQQANAETFRLPEGWTAREKVAEQLGCSVERVGDAMRPLLTCKPPRAEVKTFDVWDSGLERKVRVMAYREIAAPTKTPTKSPTKTEAGKASPLPSDRAFTIADLRGRGTSWSEIGRQLGCSKTAARKYGARRGIK